MHDLVTFEESFYMSEIMCRKRTVKVEICISIRLFELAVLLLVALAKIWAPASTCGWGFGIGLTPFVVVTTHELGRSMELASIHFWWVLFVGYVLELLCIIGLMLWWLLSLVGQGAVSLGQICETGLQSGYATRPNDLRPRLGRHAVLSEAEMGRLNSI